MKIEELRVKVREWDFQSIGTAKSPSHYSSILNQLDYHATRKLRVYLPTEHPNFNPSYMDRLARWVGNLTDDRDQKLLLEYALYISFFSHDDFVALYQTAFTREIARWVATQINARLEPHGGKALDELVQRQIHQHTWFCPVTDSMDINEFYKVNHLKGVGHRPGFATLQMLAEDGEIPDPKIARNIIHYMENPSSDPCRPLPPLERIVLLEDIVGSGSQCHKAIKWAVANLGKPVLFVPLILCPNGVEVLRTEEQQSAGQLNVRPVIELRRSELLGPERCGEKGWPITEDVENLAIRCSSRSADGINVFGYLSTGCSLVTFSNTPDNTLPLVHHKPNSGDWEPIFPRIFRE